MRTRIFAGQTVFYTSPNDGKVTPLTVEVVYYQRHSASRRGLRIKGRTADGSLWDVFVSNCNTPSKSNGAPST